MPSPDSTLSSRPTAAMAWRQAVVVVHWEPTWKVTPYGRRPRPRVRSSRALASWASAPNLRDRGNRLVESSTRSRT
jgi:hypothetical protein